MRPNIIAAVILLMLGASGCKDYGEYLYVYFPAGTEYVYCCIPEHGIGFERDTTIYFTPDKMELMPVKSDEEGNLYAVVWFLGLDDLFYGIGDSDTVSFFFFDKETVENVAWRTIVQGNMVWQRYDFCEADLRRLKCRIHCPPTPDMEGIHMYPPYGTY